MTTLFYLYMFNKKEWTKEYQKTERYKTYQLEYQREYKKKNREKLNAQDNLSRKKRRISDPEKYRLLDKDHRKKYKDKIVVRVMLYDNIKSGRIKKPEKCSVCNEVKKIEGHHRDYSKPLEVVWLCRICHTSEHKALKK